VLVHRWRSEEQAILVGSRTVVNDDPLLTVRHIDGRQPLRAVIDRGGIVPARARIFQPPGDTLLVTATRRPDLSIGQILVRTDEHPIDALFTAFSDRGITSVLVEGGARLLNLFLEHGEWDEARVITGGAILGGGTPAPMIPSVPARIMRPGPDTIHLFVNGAAPDPHWPW
jgi:diaminohydroxyphosphoribosylaminopyrimidine deaminase/5-amino-6-(5-phosphoribosylamino)uracil reductase